ncbi:MAG: ATP-binding cassette domain-containing protein [Thermomicrobiales bacterium]|nr:ATP-binding cassette domain-containing protein [Thermomicrobiales bacterium]
MSIIRAEALIKEFVRPKRHTGRFAAVRNLVTRESVTNRAVDGISLEIEEGEIVGYLGPNGAGKSTTIKMLSGILVPTSGSVEVCGLVPWQQRTTNAFNIGVVFGQRSQLWWDLPLDESLNLIGRMYRMAPEHYRRNREMLVELLEMQTFLGTPVRQLSLGQRMRGDLAAAVLYEPPVLFLDEPTVGLDVVAKERIRAFIEQINAERRTTVLLTTHDLGDVERLCRRLIIIDHGKVLFDGPTEELKRRYAPHRLLDIVVRSNAIALLDSFFADLPPHLIPVSHDGMRATLAVDPVTTPLPAAIAEVSAAVPVMDLGVREPALEGIIREIYERREVAP